MKTMVTPDEALQTVLAQTRPLGCETVSLEAALGRTLSRDVVSSVDLPPFANSAMDGYALRAEDTCDVTPARPCVLKVLETIAAGAVPSQAVSPGTCSQIMTGAAMPEGADAVVMREETVADDAGTVSIGVVTHSGQHIRRAGSDVRCGETVLRAGQTIGAAQWSMLAGLGIAQVEVSRIPRVAVITTGDEIVALSETLGEGQIRDSNSYALRALAVAAGAQCVHFKVGDSADKLQQALQSCAPHFDAIVTSGGVSAGDFDPVRDVLPKIGDVHFWKIAMKPGKPVMFATLHQGAVPVFGLPGNPVSVMVTFEQFVRPALLPMQGRCAVQRRLLWANLESELSSAPDKVEYVRALLTYREDGHWTAATTGDQGSGRLSTMTRANALLVIPRETCELAAGARVRAQMIDWPEVE